MRATPDTQSIEYVFEGLISFKFVSQALAAKAHFVRLFCVRCEVRTERTNACKNVVYRSGRQVVYYTRIFAEQTWPLERLEVLQAARGATSEALRRSAVLVVAESPSDPRKGDRARGAPSTHVWQVPPFRPAHASLDYA